MVGRRLASLRGVLTLLLAGSAGPAAAQPASGPPPYETVVTAPPRPPGMAREDPSASASVITGDRPARSGESLPQLLSELPGVVVTRYGSFGSLATVSLRGSSPNQVAIYADGVPLDSALTGSIDLGLVPLTGAQRIEVYRGASPLTLGSPALGGVLSLTSESPERSGVSAHGGLGSFATRLGGGQLAWVGAGANLVARVAALDTAADFPYRSDNRTLFDPGDDRTLRRQNNQLAQLDGALRLGVPLPAGRQLALSLSALDRRQGLPARGTDESFVASLRRRRLLGSARFESGQPLSARGHLRATAYVLWAEQRLADPLGEVTFVATDSRDRSLTGGATVTGTRPLATWLALSGMAEARHEGFQPYQRQRPDRRPPGRRALASAGLAATARLVPQALEVIATVRAEAARDQVSAVDLFGGSPTMAAPSNRLLPAARLGLLHTPHPTLRLRANLGSYGRLPTLSERYGNGGLIVGNPALAPERGVSADLGGTLELRPRSGQLWLDGAVFAAAASDLIHFQQLGYFAGYANVARSRSVGVELALHGQLGRWGRLLAQTTAMDVRDRSGGPGSGRPGRLLPHQPRVRAYLRPELRDLPLGRNLALGLHADGELTGGRYQDPANLVRQPARLILGAGASLDYHPAGLRAVVTAYNLRDSRAADVLDFPLPGRSLFGTLQFSYPIRQIGLPGASP
jgi:vitamin B12 transporter